MITFLVLFGVSVPTLALVYLTKFSGKKQKKVVKTVKEENTEAITTSYQNTINVLSEQNNFLVQENKTIKKRLAAEIGVNLRAEQEENPQQEEIKITTGNLEEHYDIDINAAMPLVKSMKSTIPFIANMDDSKIPELINNPLVKKFVWKYIKENKDEMIDLGVIVPKGQLTQIQETKEEPKEENPQGMMDLKFADNNSRYMA